MERFDLAQPRCYPDQATNSLEILQEFARVWSQTLRRISLPFDGSALLPCPIAVKFKFEKLVELDVGRSYIPENSIVSVAEFLKTISPGHLDIMVLHAFEDEDDFVPFWNAVMKKVNAEIVIHSDNVPT